MTTLQQGTDQGRARLSESAVTLGTAVLAVVSFAAAITTPPRSGPFCQGDCIGPPYTEAGQYVPRDYLWMYPAVLLVVATVVLFGYLHERRAGPEYRWVAGVGRSFAGIAATVLLVTYGIQLFVLQPGLATGRTEGLSAWSQYHPAGLFIGLENLGYAILAVAFVFAGAALRRDESRWVRASSRVFLTGGAVTLALLLLLAAVYRSDLTYRFEVWSILISWLVLATTGVLLTLAARNPVHGSGPASRLGR